MDALSFGEKYEKWRCVHGWHLMLNACRQLRGSGQWIIIDKRYNR